MKGKKPKHFANFIAPEKYLTLFIDIHTHHPDSDTGVISVQSLYADLASATKGKLCTIGVHPCYSENHEQLLGELAQYAALPNVLGIGECGLDTTCNNDITLQGAIFGKQIRLANHAGKPLIIHCVRAFDELLRLVDEIKPEVPVIIHGYNKKGTVAQRLLAHNIYLSFGAAIRNTNSPAAAVLKDIPSDRFFLETDDADVNISEIYRCAADIRETAVESLILQLQQNFRNVFKYEL